MGKENGKTREPAGGVPRKNGADAGVERRARAAAALRANLARRKAQARARNAGDGTEPAKPPRPA